MIESSRTLVNTYVPKRLQDFHSLIFKTFKITTKGSNSASPAYGPLLVGAVCLSFLDKITRRLLIHHVVLTLTGQKSKKRFTIFVISHTKRKTTQNGNTGTAVSIVTRYCTYLFVF